MTFSSDNVIRREQTVLPFQARPPRVLRCSPSEPFTPRGLIIWGAPDLATVSIRGFGMILGSADPPIGIPVRMFASGKSFEQIAAHIEAGLQLPAWLNWPTLTVTTSIDLEFDSHVEDSTKLQALFWGWSFHR